MRVVVRGNIGIRTQAIVVIALAAAWYWCLWLSLCAGKGFISSLSLFWNVVFLFCPFIAPFFTVQLLISYYGTGRPYRWWVRFAVVATSIQWLLILMHLLDAGVLF